MPTWILEHELTDPIVDREAPPGYQQAVVLVRHAGLPLGVVRAPCHGGVLRAATLRGAVAADSGISGRMYRRALEGWLLGHAPAVDAPPAASAAALPSLSCLLYTSPSPRD